MALHTHVYILYICTCLYLSELEDDYHILAISKKVHIEHIDRTATFFSFVLLCLTFNLFETLCTLVETRLYCGKLFD